MASCVVKFFYFLFLKMYFTREHNFLIYLSPISLYGITLKAEKKKKIGEECTDMAVHHQMRECLEFYHQQWAGEQGESQTRHSFYCLHLRLGSRGGGGVLLSIC